MAFPTRSPSARLLVTWIVVLPVARLPSSKREKNLTKEFSSAVGVDAHTAKPVNLASSGNDGMCGRPTAAPNPRVGVSTRRPRQRVADGERRPLARGGGPRCLQTRNQRPDGTRRFCGESVQERADPANVLRHNALVAAPEQIAQAATVSSAAEGAKRVHEDPQHACGRLVPVRLVDRQEVESRHR